MSANGTKPTRKPRSWMSAFNDAEVTRCLLMTQSEHCGRSKMLCGLRAQRSGSAFEPEDALPVLLHADHGPAVLLRFVVERLGKCADLGVRQPRGWAVSIFTRRIVVEDKHFEVRAVAGCGVFEHLAVAGGVAERGMRALADHEVNALGLAGIVVIKEELRVFD